jgi:RNA polymerase-binding transcription factor DksA
VNHDDDLARLALLDTVEAELAAVTTALERLDSGNYGQCEGCGEAIADLVLADDPLTVRCAACPPLAS